MGIVDPWLTAGLAVLDVDGRPHARVAPPVTVSLAERLRARARGED